MDYEMTQSDDKPRNARICCNGTPTPALNGGVSKREAGLSSEAPLISRPPVWL